MHHHTTAPPPPATTAPGASTRCFPAVPAQVRQARQYLAGLLDDFPATSDALACVSELASNAIQHTRSARPGGQFTVTVTRTSGHLRVDVTDDGGPWHPQPHPGGERGRGLVIVAAMARWGVTGNGEGPRTVWFEMPARS